MSQRNSGYARRENEAYFTPPWVVDCLLDFKPFAWEAGRIFDPCCGDGQIVKACIDRGLEADGQDIHCYGFKEPGENFLTMDSLPHGYSRIITNPPYGNGGKLAVEFIEHASCRNKSL
jgi:tRNA1(Val) A37 N6-methylase TrmN6